MRPRVLPLSSSLEREDVHGQAWTVQQSGLSFPHWDVPREALSLAALLVNAANAIPDVRLYAKFGQSPITMQWGVWIGSAMAGFL